MMITRGLSIGARRSIVTEVRIISRRQSFEEFQARRTGRGRDPRLSVELFRAVEYLSFAKNLLKSGRSSLATKYAEEAKKTAKEAKRMHKEVLARIDDIERRVFHAKMIGYDTTKAQGLLEEAKTLILDTKYKQALELIKKTEESLYRAQYLPFPLLDTKIKIKTLIDFEDGNIMFRVKIENHMNETLGSIVLIPSVPQDVFTELPEQVIGEIQPYQSKEVTFTLSPKIENWNIGIPGALIQGRDVTVRTILSCNYGEAKYKVRVENNTQGYIENLFVTPFVPQGLEPDSPEKIITIINPVDGETVVFDLRPKGIAAIEGEDMGEFRSEEYEEDEEYDDEQLEWDQAAWEFQEELGEEPEMEWEGDDDEDDDDEEFEEEEEEEDEDEFADLEASDFKAVKEDFSFISHSPDKIHKIKKKSKK
jgi:hypothetical protein